MQPNNQNDIVIRRANDDFAALHVAAGMQSVEHVDVVSIVHESGIWHVFAKYDNTKVTVSEIDEAIQIAIKSNI